MGFKTCEKRDKWFIGLLIILNVEIECNDLIFNRLSAWVRMNVAVLVFMLLLFTTRTGRMYFFSCVTCWLSANYINYVGLLNWIGGYLFFASASEMICTIALKYNTAPLFFWGVMLCLPIISLVGYAFCVWCVCNVMPHWCVLIASFTESGIWLWIALRWALEWNILCNNIM